MPAGTVAVTRASPNARSGTLDAFVKRATNAKQSAAANTLTNSAERAVQVSLAYCISTGGTNPETKGEVPQSANIARKSSRTEMPFFKIVDDTSFSVDAFKYGPIPGCTAYFLSHFHSDHYEGLAKSFDYGMIYCSSVTRNLILAKIRVDEKFVCGLDFGIEYDIQGVLVTLIDANHCPGAAMFHFQLPSGKKHLHTGDFRCCPEMLSHPLIRDAAFDCIYLDNTYGLSSRYCFPSQPDAIGMAVQIVQRKMDNVQNRLVPLKVMYLVGSYLVGKEKIALEIAEKFDWKICVQKDKKKTIDCLDWPSLQRRITLDSAETPLQIVSMQKLNKQSLNEILTRNWPRFTHIVAFKPTGWVYAGASNSLPNAAMYNHSGPRGLRRGVIEVFSIPYSEHSSFSELELFLRSVQCSRIIPTVNV